MDPLEKNVQREAQKSGPGHGRIMIWTISVLLFSVLISIGIILIRHSFYRMALKNLGLVDIMLDTRLDELVKHKRLIQSTKQVLISLFTFLFLVGIVIIVALAPILVVTGFDLNKLNEVPWNNTPSIVVLIIGSVIPFVVFSKIQPPVDYSELSKLLHRLILDNQNIGKLLFSFDQKRIKKKHTRNDKEFYVVTGLARAGTTALTTILARSKEFYSLTYAHMPFLTAPYTWSGLSGSRKEELKERAHGDKVLVGFNSVEALEEYFFKMMLNDRYVDRGHLAEHQIDQKTANAYLNYQNAIRSSEVGSYDDPNCSYLAKNNNFLLRYVSAKEFLKPKLILLFRDPLEHANSLLKQHLRFNKMHADDPFSLEYMNWLGHHEFGSDHRPFRFEGRDLVQHDLPKNAVDYWVSVWINYYTRVLDLMPDNKILLVSYSDVLADPDSVVRRIQKFCGKDLHIDPLERFSNPPSFKGDPEKNLATEASEIYAKLQKLAAY